MKILLPLEAKGERLDSSLVSFFAEHHPDLHLSRTKVQNLINGGHVKMAKRNKTLTSQIVHGGEAVWVHFPEAKESEKAAEDIPLSIVYEDSHLIIIDKPCGMVVHPAPGNPTGTLLNALLHYCGDSLEGIQGVKQPGIVHRLDKQTSGLMMVAKTEQAHLLLSDMLKEHVIRRKYYALIWGVPKDLEGTVRAPIGRSFHNRQKMAIHSKGKPSTTHYKVLKSSKYISLVECRLETGRTHQIRLHMAHLGHQVLGDTLYGSVPKNSPLPIKKRAAELFPATIAHALMSYSLELEHPITQEILSFQLELPSSFSELVE
jgi:23S rRNA pseudouridine1911/1915/1917 synthase